MKSAFSRHRTHRFALISFVLTSLLSLRHASASEPAAASTAPPPNGYIEGIVTDEAGDPVFGAKVESSESGQWELLFKSPYTRSQGDGYYRLSVKPGSYDLMVITPQRNRIDIEDIIVSPGDISIANAAVLVKFRQKKWDQQTRPLRGPLKEVDNEPVNPRTAGIIEGKVVNAAGRALAGVTVRFCEGGGACFFSPTRVTLADGSFSLGPVMWDDYAVEVDYRGFQRYRLQDVVVFPGKASILDIRLTPGEGSPWPPQYPEWTPKTRPLQAKEWPKE